MSTEKTVLVTAGASGIGRVTAETFLGAGYRVHVCDVSDEAIATLARECPGIGSSRCDVSVVADVEALFAELEARYGRLDVLVNNAGISGPSAAVEDVAPEDWDRTLAVDLSGSFYVTRKAVPLLKRQGGSIVNMSSTAGLFGCPMRSPYVAAKWAIVGLTKTWAMELGPAGIRVNAICPGSVNGPRIEGVIQRDATSRGMDPEEIRRVYLRQVSLRCFAEADDVAQMALYLCSDAGKRISGQAIGLDGNTESLANWLDDN